MMLKNGVIKECSIDEKVKPIFNVEIEIKEREKSMKTILWIYGDDMTIYKSFMSLIRGF